MPRPKWARYLFVEAAWSYLPAGCLRLMGRLTVCVTVASGCRFTVEVLTKLPVMALRVTVDLLFFDDLREVVLAISLS